MGGKKTSVTALRGLQRLHGADLHNAGIRTVESLRERIARDGFAKTIAGRTAPPDQLRRALSRYELEAAAGRTDPGPRRAMRFVCANWAEAILAALVLLLAGLGARAATRPEREVVATRDLPPFQVIAPGDVKSRPANADFGVVGDSASVVGRFPLRAVPKDGALRRDQLGRVRFAPAGELQDRRVVSLAVARRTLPLAVPGTRAVLLLSPRDAGAGSAAAVVGDVIVLSAGESGDSASVVVAVRATDLPALARSLGASEVFLAQAVEPAAVDTATRK